MVKTVVAALVCGTVFVAHLSAQEVFSGDQKASPKYPKAQPAKPDAKVSVASAPAKTAAPSTHSATVAQNSDSNSAKKVAATGNAKPSKPAKAQSTSETSSAKPSTATTITKATPLVMPGQRAPSATPSPVVRPEPPLIAKAPPVKTNSTSAAANSKVPLAAVPPPSKVAKATTKSTSVDVHTQAKVETNVPNKTVAKGNSATESHSAATKAEAPPVSHPEIAAANGAAKTAKTDVKAQSATKVAAARTLNPATTVAKGTTAAESHSAATKAEAPPVSHPEIAAANSAAKTTKTDIKAQSAAKVAAAPTHNSATSVAKASTPSVETKIASSTPSHVTVAPPSEGPKRDIVMQVKKSATAQTKPTKAPAVVKAAAPTIKPTEDTEEEDTASSARVSAKPAVAPAAAVVVKKSSTPKQTVDAHSIVTVPVSLQTRKDASNGATKVAFVQNAPSETAMPPPPSDHFETAFTKLADGFDYPVGRPDAQGYYRARGFRSHGHLGEDWDGVGGGDTDLGDPIYSIGDGLVVFARDCHMGWGNVVIVRHSYREGGAIRTIDSLYGHLLNILVRQGQAVARGQKIATMGTAHGLYDAHLHLEIRKNIEIGMSRAAFAQDFSNYYDPSQFIQSHRHLQNSTGNYRVAMNTFTHDARIRWDKVRNYSHAHTGGGTSESSAALKRALAAKSE